MNLVWTILRICVIVPFPVSGTVGQANQTPAGTMRQAQDDAWWTGPLLAPSASTLSRGHFLIETYLYDVTVQGHFDSKGVRRSSPYSDGFGSLIYILYGVTSKMTVGLIPVAGYNRISVGPSSSGIGIADLTVQAQYRLTKFHEGSWIPTTSFTVQETLPTGKYDRLGNRPGDGFGNGAYTTTFAFYTQTYFWLPNGRILRMRFNISEGFPSNVNLHDVSVYGTQTGFRGHAEPGRVLSINPAWEYSLTRSWVLAFDAAYRHQGNTRVLGFNVFDPSGSTGTHPDSGPSRTFGLAPAVEYSWKPNLGVIFGVRIIPVGRNSDATISPAVAINYVH